MEMSPANMTQTHPQQRRQPAQSLEQILAPHVGITIAGGSYRCTCLHTYEPVIKVRQPAGTGYQSGEMVPDPEQRLIIDALHTQHQVERLIAAGVEEPQTGDPRAALLRRAGRTV